MEQIVFRNVGIYNSDAGELPRRKYITFRTWRKYEIKSLQCYHNHEKCLNILCCLWGGGDHRKTLGLSKLKIRNKRLFTRSFDCFATMFGLHESSDGSLTLILRRSRTGTVWFYTSTSNKRAARPKLYTRSLTRDLKLMYSRLTLVRISINL